MNLVEARSVPLPSSGLVKMEERKRPAAYDNEDSGPPLKRQVTSTVNGVSKSHQDADMPWRDDLEVKPGHLSSAKSFSGNAPGAVLLIPTQVLISIFCLEISERSDPPSDAGIQTRKEYPGIST